MDLFYTLMFAILKMRDKVAPVGDRVKKFDIKEGQVVIDYGCGVGSYASALSKAVGQSGKVYEVDAHPLAIRATKKKVQKLKLNNVEVIQTVDEVHSGIPQDNIADVVLVLDVFHMVSNKELFLMEIRRLIKKNGFMLIEIEHMSDDEIRKEVEKTGKWKFDKKIDKYIKFIASN